ncbi:ABC transporter ATP-binding protein [Neomoorella thermoacetica]|uniref:ABC transporter ATP-binding protein n=1 Tax=Neomoorella thermoacetica TaxID=1525 RepID=UPI0008FB51A3|nr:ABC transporter ATP-binding protein [Moorella thermoacetica]OIQ52753.1 lipopolysaccharide export system ATP-binding protein LptB [Moorella thermoacetica]
MDVKKAQPLLQVKGLTHYFGGLKAVSDFNLELQGGEIYGLIGPNGAGKTTVFNLITGVYRPTSGRILFRGSSIVGLLPHQIISMGVARTFQNIRLFKELSVLDNVRIAYYSKIQYRPWSALVRTARFREQELRVREKSLELLDLFDLRKQAPVLAKSLPYGEQRRLEIVRALAGNPSLLLLDEPAAGMNPSEIERLMQTIRWIRERFSLTILLIEHQMRLVMNICEKVKVLDFGETIAEGSPQEIRSNPRVLEAYLGKEMII